MAAPRGAPNPAIEPPTTGKPLIIGRSGAIANICALAERIGAADAKVLITGESGVGKDLVAQHIHFHSRRASQPLVAVNCAGVPETLLESEFFGHVRGAFTDAHRDKVGKLQLAHNGTVFLDEVAEMSLRMQAMFLRFLENGEIHPVGADAATTKVDVRVLAATNRDLHEAVASGQFREDLLYRLDVVHIRVPPLRERREDVAALIEHLLARAERRIALTDDALRALETYRWPGNVRELQNVVERLIWMAPRDVIGVQDLPAHLRPGRVDVVLPVRERRRQRSDDLYKALTEGALEFWAHVHRMFLDRDLTRHDLRELVRKGLKTTHGNYRGVVRLFGMPDKDYKRFLNFLGTHDCVVDFREFRSVLPVREASPAVGQVPERPDGRRGHPRAASTT